MKIERNVRFLLHKRKNATGQFQIRMRVTIKGQKPLDFPLGFSINPENWIDGFSRAVDGTPNAGEINRKIDDWTAKVDEVCNRYGIVENRVPSPDDFKELFNNLVGRSTKVSRILDELEHPDFFTVFDRFVDEVGAKNEWTPSTKEKFAALKNHLQGFDKDLSFDVLSESKLQAYVQTLHDKDFHNTTVQKNLAFLRWFLRWSFAQGYYKGNLHDTFKPKLKGTSVESKEVIYCTREELRAIEEHTFLPHQGALERVRDVFVFQCYTGLRYSDVAKLKRSDIKANTLRIVTKKTVDGLYIELNDHSQAILDKYKDNVFPGGLALPVISNEKMNAHLKTLGQMCQLEEPTRIVWFKGNERKEEVLPKWALLTTHVARRTFVVMALQLGIPPEVIMRWTGHSDFKAMRPYMAIVDELKKNAMSKFNAL